MVAFWRRKRADASSDSDDWIVVAQFNAFSETELSADLAVAKLEANGIPTVRFPTGIINAPCIGMLGPEPVRVMVPPDRADEARQLLAEEEQ